MVGNPNYKIGDQVSFYFDNGHERTLMNGEIGIVDAYGIFGDNTQVYYDIYVIVDGKEWLYKHIPESEVI